MSNKYSKGFTAESINEWADQYLKEARQYIQWAEQEKDSNKEKEIYDMSEGLRELLLVFYGYRGSSKNMVENIISKYLYDLRDESVFTEAIWTTIKNSILSYDPTHCVNFVQVATTSSLAKL